ncbi:hypothetical protein RRF57_011021 [Xylaria bambusicola]|uniref:Uncharacterized protein n=1 Tax=Xylaria bambusicola TaxID=326684 RepID=A0AAN7V275_9PEZI
MRHEDRPRPIENPLAAELIPEPWHIRPECDGRRLKALNFPIEQSFRVLKDEPHFHIRVSRDDFVEFGFDAWQVGDHAYLTKGLGRRGDDVVLLPAL